MTNFLITKANKIKMFIGNKKSDPWMGTPFEDYKSLSNKVKGNLGEMIVSELMKDLTYEVNAAQNPGHDRVIDGYKTEIKFALAITDSKTNTIKDDTWILNHLSLGKDWDRLIFMGVNSDLTFKVFYMTKDSFRKAIEDKSYFSHQQGGADVENDDFMIQGGKLIKLIQSEYTFDIEEF
jgi:hypothetical protein